VRNNRIGKYRTILEHLVALGPEGRGRMSNQDAADAIMMSEEIQQFCFTSARVLNHPHLVESRQAKEMFSGSLMAGKENDTSPRDLMFELSTAGLIQEAGMEADVSGIVDIWTVFEGRPVLVECKRPQSMKKLVKNTKEAAKQLSLRLNDEPSAVGIIAVAFGKLLTGGTARLNAWDKKQLETMMIETVTMLRKKMHTELVARPAVNGIIAQVSVAGINGSENRPFVATQYSVDQLARGAPNAKEHVAGRFLQALQRGAFQVEPSAG
jgi:hypothetical protein